MNTFHIGKGKKVGIPCFNIQKIMAKLLKATVIPFTYLSLKKMQVRSVSNQDLTKRILILVNRQDRDGRHSFST